MRLAACAALLVMVCTTAFGQIQVPRPQPMVADGSWSAALKDHPRVLGPKSFVQALAKAKPEAYQRIKALDTNLLATGIVHAVEGAPRDRIAPHIQKAMKVVERGATNTHQDTWLEMEQVALVFDLFYDQIPPGDRRNMIEWLNASFVSFTTDENAFHNSTLSKVFCYLRIAYATWGENAKAGEFRDYAIKKLYEGKLLPVILEFGAGGGYTECGWYTRGSLWHLVQGLELARRFEGYDGFQKAPAFFYNRLAYELHQPYPNLGRYNAEHYAVEGDGSNIYGGHTEYPRLMRTVLAQYFRGSELSRYIANKQRKGSSAEIAMIDFLIQEGTDRGQAPLDLKDFPLAHMASGIGRVYARSDWTDSATWLRFECGDYFNQHQHFEAGNFEIFRYAPLATESGEYSQWNDAHSVNWLIRTIAHNCILIHQPDEPWQNRRSPRNTPYANDGGQSNSPSVADSLDQWKKEQAKHERGDIVAYENRPEFMYVAGDCTKAYASSKAALVLRQLVFIRPHTFVILDRVNSTKSEYEKTWLLHCHNEPQIEGKSTKIVNDKGQLFVQTLLPERAGIEKIKGYTYRGQTYPASKHALNDAAHKWRIEVKPAQAQTQDVFLHVLSTEGAPNAQFTRDNDQITARGQGWGISFAPTGSGTLTVNGKTFPLTPGIKRGKYE